MRRYYKNLVRWWRIVLVKTTQPTIAGSNKGGWLYEMLKRAILEDENNAEEEQNACGDDLRHALAEKMEKCVLSDNSM